VFSLSVLCFVCCRYKRTYALLKDKEDEMKAVAEELIRVETINRDDVIRLIGKRPFEDALSKMSIDEIAGTGTSSEASGGAPVVDAPIPTPSVAARYSKTE
jgi:AFG3 family protein